MEVFEEASIALATLRAAPNDLAGADDAIASDALDRRACERHAEFLAWAERLLGRPLTVAGAEPPSHAGRAGGRLVETETETFSPSPGAVFRPGLFPCLPEREPASKRSSRKTLL